MARFARLLREVAEFSPGIRGSAFPLAQDRSPLTVIDSNKDMGGSGVTLPE
jgi:hypothetical protein